MLVGWKFGEQEVKEENGKDGGTSIGGESGEVLPEALGPRSKVAMLKRDSAKVESLMMGHNEFNN